MSRAFVKESDDGAGEELPERAISPHRNLVTARGLEQIAASIRRLDEELRAARAAADRAAVARCQRDLRYWHRRRTSAELVPAPGAADRVRFGSRVTIELDDGSRRQLTIVGEDEANPALGSIAYVAPVAAAMIGAREGDRVSVGAGAGEILEIA